MYWTKDKIIHPNPIATRKRAGEQEHIISGTFEFTVQGNNGELIKITDGRFDLNHSN